MIFEYLNTFFGILKIYMYKILNIRKIKFSGVPKINFSAKLNIKKNSVVNFEKNIRIRRNVSFYCYDGGKIDIGNDVFINENCIFSCRKRIKIGDNCIVGNNVYIYDNDHDYRNDLNNYTTSDVIIGNNCWIGCNVVILRGVQIGDNCVIGSGTIITHDIPNNSKVYNEKKLIVNQIIKVGE